MSGAKTPYQKFMESIRRRISTSPQTPRPFEAQPSATESSAGTVFESVEENFIIARGTTYASPYELASEPALEPVSENKLCRVAAHDASSKFAQFFVYKPLPSGNWTRVLQIEPGTKNEPLHCQLKLVNFDEKKLTYEALSYHWGNPTPTEKIICNKLPLMITSNLHEALIHIRRSDRKRYLWADAICINQDDTLERNHQVRLMCHVYARATRVLVWLGESSHAESRSALELICKLAKIEEPKLRPSFTIEGEEVTGVTLSEDKFFGALGPESSTHLSMLFLRSWFERVWVIQEVVLAKVVHCLWGDATIDFCYVGPAARWILNKIRVPTATRGFRRHVGNAEYIYTLSCMRRDEGRTGPILDLLYQSRAFECSNDLDRIFGLLGLEVSRNDHVNSNALVEPDYNYACIDLYTSVAMKILLEQKDTRLLTMAQSSKHPEQNWPSWVPDWRTMQTAQSFPFATTDAHSAGSCIGAELSAYHVVLSTKGLQVAQVETTTRPLASDYFQAFFGQLVSATHSDALGYIPYLRARYSDTLLAHTITAGAEYGNLTSARYERLTEDLATFCELLSPANGTTPRQREKGFNIVYSFAEAVHRAVFGRCLFWTQHGMLGLGPATLQEEDMLCVIFGCQMPFILRKAPNGQFRLVGECYVYDIMKGEAVEAWKKTDKPATTFELV